MRPVLTKGPFCKPTDASTTNIRSCTLITSPHREERIGQGGQLVMTTSKKDAKIASKLLSSSKTPKAVKSVAGSALSQSKGKSKKK